MQTKTESDIQSGWAQKRQVERGNKMLRKMRRENQQLSEEDCIRVLSRERRGVLSVHGDNGYSYGVPMNFLYEDGNSVSTVPGRDIQWILFER